MASLVSLSSLARTGKMYQYYKQQRVTGWVQCIDSQWRKPGTGWLSKDFTLDGWQGETVLHNQYVSHVFLYCLLGSCLWSNNCALIFLQFSKSSTNFSSKFLFLQATGVSLAKDTLWDVACAVDEHGTVYLFHCGNFTIALGIKASQSVTPK